MIGHSDDLAHALVPLSLAVARVREAAREVDLVGRCGSTDPDAIAAFIASLVPIYSYSADTNHFPAILTPQRLYQAVFRDGGKEAHFVDGEPPLASLAVHKDDVACVLEVLRFPRHAARIRGRFARMRSAIVRQRAKSLVEESRRLRLAAAAIGKGPPPPRAQGPAQPPSNRGSDVTPS